jgi:pyridoxal/pyridoxine/pyridoxamine kinase
MVSKIVAGGFVPAEDSIRIVMMWVTRVKLKTYSFNTEVCYASL